ncbi:MAG: hypothetical protein ACLUI3_07260 [Christensenellales bacterium]
MQTIIKRAYRTAIERMLLAYGSLRSSTKTLLVSRALEKIAQARG